MKSYRSAMSKLDAEQSVDGFSDTESSVISSSLSNFSALFDDDEALSILSRSIVSHNRTVNIEPLEYVHRETKKILDPPLNLKRVGYFYQNKILEGDDFTTNDLPVRSDVGQVLVRRLRRRIKPDCTVVVGDHNFRCHLMVLQVWSEVADAYNVVTKIEIPLEECTPDAFKYIYKWMLYGHDILTILTAENVLDIYTAVKYMEIKDLIEDIWQLLCNQDLIEEYQAYYLYLEAKRKALEKIAIIMFPRIRQFFIVLVSSQDWVELDPETACAILKSNYIVVGSEMEVFLSALRWLLYDWKNRSQHKLRLMKCVRFGLIPWWQLLDIERNVNIPEFIYVSKDTAIAKLIEEGLAYRICDAASTELPDWHDELKVEVPKPRPFRQSSYTYIFTFREFVIRLDALRRRIPTQATIMRREEP